MVIVIEWRTVTTKMVLKATRAKTPPAHRKKRVGIEHDDREDKAELAVRSVTTVNHNKREVSEVEDNHTKTQRRAKVNMVTKKTWRGHEAVKRRNGDKRKIKTEQVAGYSGITSEPLRHQTDSTPKPRDSQLSV